MFAQAKILRRKLDESKMVEQDAPEDADTYALRVKEGDLLLVMTDGVSDNLFNHEIQKIVNQHIKEYEEQDEISAEALSEKIAQAAAQKVRAKGRTPFSEKYKKQFRS